MMEPPDHDDGDDGLSLDGYLATAFDAEATGGGDGPPAGEEPAAAPPAMTAASASAMDVGHDEHLPAAPAEGNGTARQEMTSAKSSTASLRENFGMAFQPLERDEATAPAGAAAAAPATEDSAAAIDGDANNNNPGRDFQPWERNMEQTAAGPVSRVPASAPVTEDFATSMYGGNAANDTAGMDFQPLERGASREATEGDVTTNFAGPESLAARPKLDGDAMDGWDTALKSPEGGEGMPQNAPATTAGEAGAGDAWTAAREDARQFSETTSAGNSGHYSGGPAAGEGAGLRPTQRFERQPQHHAPQPLEQSQWERPQSEQRVQPMGQPPLESQQHQSQLEEKQPSKPQGGGDDDDDDDQIEIASWSSDSDIEVIEKPGASSSNGAMSGSSAGAAAASFHSREQHMPPWMASNNGPAPSVGGSHPQHTLPYAAASHLQHQRHQYPPPAPSMSHLEMPSSHTPTWMDILPKNFFAQQRQPQYHQNQYYQQNQYSQGRKRLTLTLINMWEFTITIESLDYSCGYGGYYGNNNPGSDAVPGLRAAIKKISRDHVGRDGRTGAVFERGSGGEGIVPDDPILKNLTSEEAREAADAGKGRWRIPLGAYHALVSYLIGGGNNVVEGIPPAQLRAATLGRERLSRKDYPTAEEMMGRGVHPNVAAALAPYQRGGVEFVLDKEGRALLADEMGLGKTVQAIAAMSAYRSDWPLLVLCPSTARYHWEAEFRCWMGSESTAMAAEKGVAAETEEHPILRNSQLNVLTSGRDALFNHETDGSSTQVVICSIGLIVNLVASGRVRPGMFRAVIVDESHALKSKSTKRTKAVVPLLKAAERCLLLSGTPALARPSELWPQLSVLGDRRRSDSGEGEDGTSGVWCDEAEFMSKYVRPKGEEGGNKTRLAELHTMLTSTVMIRRMKVDILKNLPTKVREKAYINIEDDDLKNEFRTYMQILRQGKGVLGKLARKHHDDQKSDGSSNMPEHEHYPQAGEDGMLKSREVLHHLYGITGRSKVARVTKMLKSWIADPTKGKLCIFAHHLEVLDEISRGAGLSNARDSSTKFIRIDGSTSPKARQEQILTFQTNPAVRIAMLGITAAGVAVTLTASSTVWFAELFWTPAIMIQAEDRVHRIGQQARVRCLYFIGRGTLDDVLWRLIEKKFRDLGEFVEGKENMGIALERELEDEDHEEILKTEDKADEATGKRKAQDVFSELLDTDDIEIKNEIDELIHEEEDMLNIKNEEEEEDVLDVKEKANSSVENVSPAHGRPTSAQDETSETVIELSDDEDADDRPPTISQVRELYRESGVMAKLKIDPTVQFKGLRIYSVQYPGPTYGLIMVSCNGRVVVKSHQTSQPNQPKIGSIIVGVNGHLIPHGTSFQKVLQVMKHFMRTPPVTVIFAEDDEFTSMFVEDFLPNCPARRLPTAMAPTTYSAAAPSGVRQAPQQNPSEVIDLLDDE